METEDEADNVRVGTGQHWLDLDDDDQASSSTKTKKSPAKKSLEVLLSSWLCSVVGHERENGDFNVYVVDQQNEFYHIELQDIPFSLHMAERNGLVRNLAMEVGLDFDHLQLQLQQARH